MAPVPLPSVIARVPASRVVTEVPLGMIPAGTMPAPYSVASASAAPVAFVDAGCRVTTWRLAALAPPPNPRLARQS